MFTDNLADTKNKTYSISHDHFHALMLAQIISDNASDFPGLPKTLKEKIDYTIKFYNLELAHHFYIEENILFPEIKGINHEIDELIDDMALEHKIISDLIEHLPNNNQAEKNLTDIARILEAHVEKEERNLFVKIQKSVDEDRLAAIAEKLKLSGYENIYKN